MLQGRANFFMEDTVFFEMSKVKLPAHRAGLAGHLPVKLDPMSLHFFL